MPKRTLSDRMEKKCIVASCIIIRRGRILMLKHKKLGVWLYPGGHIEENEIPTEAAIREAYEETGIRVSLIGERRIKSANNQSTELPEPFLVMYENVNYKSGRHMHFDLIYLSKPAGRRGRIAAGESTELKWVTEKEAESIDTYENVRVILRHAFKAMGR